jgi:hypothetical protein
MRNRSGSPYHRPRARFDRNDRHSKATAVPARRLQLAAISEVDPAANASSSLLARFSPHLELSMRGEPPSVQGPCCHEVIIEGQEQLPLLQECSAG